MAWIKERDNFTTLRSDHNCRTICGNRIRMKKKSTEETDWPLSSDRDEAGKGNCIIWSCRGCRFNLEKGKLGREPLYWEKPYCIWQKNYNQWNKLHSKQILAQFK